VVDLRIQSPTYGKFEVFSLSAEKANMVYIPIGLAHGFEVLSETAIMIYKVSTVYSPEHDTGILWNSVNIPWQTRNPIISQRDQDFCCFDNFNTPF
jgi:dTDP-4-dehydrorhamnose 3,5-epimerase